MNKFIMSGFLVTVSALINPEVANSAILKGRFHVDITTGSLAGTNLPGHFQYDDSSLTGIGFESIGNGVGLFEFEFDWLGVTYRENSNPGFASRINFKDGEITGIQYFLGWDKPTPNFYVNQSAFLYEDSPGILDGRGKVSYKTIPEPITVLGSLTALIFGVTFKQKKIKSTKS